MDTTKFTMGIVGLVVIILMVTGAVLPAVEDAQKNQYSTDNNTVARYVIAADNTATSANPKILTLNADGFIVIDGVADTQAYAENIDKLWAYNCSIRVQYSTNLTTYYYQCVVWANATASTQYSVSKLSYDGATLTGYASDDTVSFTLDSDFFIYPYSKGTYGEFSLQSATNRDATFINKSAIVYVGVPGNTYGFLKGTYADGFQQVGYSGNATLDTRTLNYTSAESDDGLTWKFASKPTSTLSDSGGVLDPSTTDWLYVYAPIQYNYISDSDSSIISLVGIIPLLLIIVAVLYAVRLMGASRN